MTGPKFIFGQSLGITSFEKNTEQCFGCRAKTHLFHSSDYGGKT